MKVMKTKIYRTIDHNLIHDWEHLWNKSKEATYCNSPFWFVSVLDTFAISDYVIIALYESNELLGIGAVVKRKKWGISYYTVAPEDFVCGVPFLFYDANKKVVKTFREALLSLGLIHLENVPEKWVTAIEKDSNAVTKITRTINLLFTFSKDTHGAVFIPKRSRLLSRIRGIEQAFVIRTFDGTSDEGLKLTFAIDAISSKQQKGYNTFSQKQIRVFYQTLAKRFAKKMLITILYYKKHPIAYSIGFLSGKTYFWSQSAFDGNYRHVSPGKVLLVKLIDSLGEKGITMFDFGSGDYQMKRMITQDYQTLYAMTLSRNKMLRTYFTLLTATKQRLYEILQSNAQIYSLYKKITKIIHI